MYKRQVEKLTVNQEVTSEVGSPAQSVAAAKVTAAPAPAAPTQNTQRSSSDSTETFVGRDLGKADGTAVGIAMQYQGIKYNWGHASPAEGFDCSGFVSYVSVSYTHLTLPTIAAECRSRWSPYH